MGEMEGSELEEKALLQRTHSWPNNLWEVWNQMPQMKEILWLTYHNHNYHPEEKKNFWFGKLFQLFFFFENCNCDSICTAQERQWTMWEKKVMKSPGVTWLLAAHTLCLLVCLWNWFSLCWHQGDHDNSVMLGLESRCWSCSCCWALPPATTSLIGRCCGCYTKIKGPTPPIFQLNALSSPFLPGSPLQRPFKYVFSKDDFFFFIMRLWRNVFYIWSIPLLNFYFQLSGIIQGTTFLTSVYFLFYISGCFYDCVTSALTRANDLLHTIHNCFFYVFFGVKDSVCLSSVS